MFRADLLLIMRRINSLQTAIGSYYTDISRYTVNKTFKYIYIFREESARDYKQP